ncbi:hypothetical protein [Nocardia sp. NBC_00511]|uniref:hypothetical protein n=1 Tax=Nocardia sp. NBC_00511 TaxID=2903591 RepID=UPI0030DFC4F0
MLHVWAVCPAESTDAALRVLRAEPGATLITVQRGAAVEPRGDVVECVLARESADAVIDALRGLGVMRAGGVGLEDIDTVLSDSAERAVENAPTTTSDAVVWEQLIAQTGEASTLTPSFLTFITIGWR